jgi:hypothetical protein
MSAQAKRPRRFIVSALLALALITGLFGMFALWLNRQALNVENGTEVSSKLLANDEIRTALGTYLVDQLFASTDVAAEIRTVLPPRAAPLAGPAAGGLKQLAEDRAPRLLARPRVEDAWRNANFAARTALLRLLNDEDTGKAVGTSGGNAVVLNLNVIVKQLADQLGLGSQLASAQSQVQQRGVTIPPSAGQLVLVRSDQIGLAQDVAKAIKGLGVVLPVLMIGLFALAVWLAVGWRRIALRRVGFCLIALGVLVVLARRVVGNQVVDSLVASESVQPAAKEAWWIITQMLYDIAVATVAYGAIIVAAAWLAGSTHAAVAARQAFAPSLRHQLAGVYATVAFVYLLVLLWGPTPATRQPVGIFGIALLVALGIELLRRQTAREFPDAQRGETAARLRAAFANARGRAADGAARRTGSAAPPAAGSDRVGDLERLATLHDHGAITDDEFATEKVALLKGA